ncbi:chalcone isomerase family protein [Stutzerimonas stutzeri]|uniref:chalcone isomerase family protein n=1 Tax=Stutzerimonas sp. S1 TaxID=3030652 RepID=UPI0022258D22|nr:chalcone isomerase family protein [Stutzerimonas sp. S1]MCW3147848.1 chalcone isomerase family protein [Stutzerimonas sp. S1]
MISPRHAILACLLWLIPLLATANWREAVPEARLIGEGELRFFGLRIYDARLWSATEPLQTQRPFALELTYHRAISRDDFVRTSLEEIQRLSGEPVDSARMRQWRAEMRQAFVDVRPGERITGVYLPGRGCRFYVNDRLQHEVADPAFAEAFFAIWLDPHSRDQKLRRDLLGER